VNPSGDDELRNNHDYYDPSQNNENNTLSHCHTLPPFVLSDCLELGGGGKLSNSYLLQARHRNEDPVSP
jgi:hypothetical protein